MDLAPDARVELSSPDEDFPASLNRLNWAAVIWGGWYALANGVWPWMFGLAGLGFTVKVLYIYLNRDYSLNPLVWGSLATASEMLVVALSVAFGLRANTELWRRGRRQAAGDLVGQRRWAIAGLALGILGFAVSASSFGRTHPGWLVPLFMAYGCRFALLFAVYLWDRRRQNGLGQSG